MALIAAGAEAPSVSGLEPEGGPRALWFFKVTCPVCQMAAPVAERLAAAFPGRVVGVGQDPDEKLRAFAKQFGTTFEVVSDPPPYAASDGYGLDTVPTLVLVQDGRVADVGDGRAEQDVDGDDQGRPPEVGLAHGQVPSPEVVGDERAQEPHDGAGC